MMMIKNFICTGDTHGGMSTISRVGNIQRNMPECKPEETGIIILGDAGLNFWLNKTDKKYKKLLNSMGFHIYCVRGNHEQRPNLIDGIHLAYDDNVNGMVWQECDYPNISYFMDGGEYNIGGYSVLVIGGAYSVDKWYRLARAGYSTGEAETADPKKCGWFKDEQLTGDECGDIWDKVQDKHYDFVFTHTAPLDWEPTDLFLNGIDQSTVDKSMEVWLNKLKDCFTWGVWCFGHYHADRVERPYVEQFYMDYEDINVVWNRYHDECTYTKEWWLPKSQYMNFWENSEEGQAWLSSVSPSTSS
jgi:3-oxoacid CoA-transferase subunit A